MVEKKNNKVLSLGVDEEGCEEKVRVEPQLEHVEPVQDRLHLDMATPPYRQYGGIPVNKLTWKFLLEYRLLRIKQVIHFLHSIHQEISSVNIPLQ